MNMHSQCRGLARLAVLAATTSCIIPTKVGDSPEADASTGDGDSQSASSQDAGSASSASTTSDATSGTTTGPDTTDTTDTTEGSTGADSQGATSDTDGIIRACAGNPRFDCAEARDCDEVDCGDYLSEWDEDGCLRPRCDEGGCPDGLSCLTPQDWGACFSSDPTTCEDVDGSCTCGGSSLPDCGGRFCIPTAAAPPAACDEFEDASSCEEAGCRYLTVVPIVDDDTENLRCDEAVSICTWFPEGEGGDDALSMYRRVGFTDATVTAYAVFPTQYDVPPLGWIPCTETPAAGVCVWWASSGNCEG